MAHHLPHPDTDDQVGTTGRPWGTYAFVLIAIVVVLGIVVLHATGVVGPGAH